MHNVVNSRASSQVISLTIQPSRWLAAYIVALHLMLFIALWQGFSLLVALLAIPLLVLLMAYCLYRWVSDRCAGRVTHLYYLNAQWRLHNATGQLPVELTKATVWRWLVVLNFYDKRRHRPLVLFIDSVDQQQWRQLQVMLRHLPVYAGTDSDASL